MKPVYRVSAWQEDGWWLARVMAASQDADLTPLNALTQARSLAKIEPMARDLIATVLDATEDDFEVAVEYTLPGSVSELVRQARGARAWLEAAQDLWQEQSAAAARDLADNGYSLRETATLLGLSHQRVDQLLGSDTQREKSPFQVLYYGSSASAHSISQDTSWLSDSVVVVLNSAAHGDQSDHSQRSELVEMIMDQLETLTGGLRVRPEPGTCPEPS
jgi:predicted transcriptional regulator